MEWKTSDLPLVHPRFLSLEFHLRFFPRFLRSRFKGKNKTGGVAFTSNLEMLVVLAVCLVLATIGVPAALNKGSALGWILAIIGVGGIGVLFIQSVGSQWRARPTFEDFLTGVFFFLVSLGSFMGIPAGMESHSVLAGLLTSIVGFVAGYWLGIAAALQLQRFGWIAVIGNMLAGLGAIILAATAVVMFLFSLFG